jgi:hypothetical protein
MPPQTSSVRAYLYVTPYHKEQVIVSILDAHFNTDTRHKISQQFFMKHCMGVSWHTPTTVNSTIPDHIFMVYWDKEIMQGIEGVIFPRIMLFKRRGKRGQVTDIGDNDLQDVTDVIHQLVHLSFLICMKFTETSDSTTITWKLQMKVGDPSKMLSPADYSSSQTACPE